MPLESGISMLLAWLRNVGAFFLLTRICIFTRVCVWVSLCVCVRLRKTPLEFVKSHKFIHAAAALRHGVAAAA